MKTAPEYIALNRAIFGATARELERIGKTGWKAWVEFYGAWKGFANENLDHSADLAVTTDYRTVLHEVSPSAEACEIRTQFSLALR